MTISPLYEIDAFNGLWLHIQTFPDEIDFLSLFECEQIV